MTPSNARLIAELQAVSIAVRLFGLHRLPDVMRPTPIKKHEERDQ